MWGNNKDSTFMSILLQIFFYRNYQLAILGNTTDLNSECSFSLIIYHTKAKQTCLSHYLGGFMTFSNTLASSEIQTTSTWLAGFIFYDCNSYATSVFFSFFQL